MNTVVIDGSSLRGYNTDGGGMVMACGQAGIELSDQRVLRGTSANLEEFREVLIVVDGAKHLSLAEAGTRIPL